MKQDYMARLTRWARWYLPRQEAEDVIADYRDIVGTPPRPEKELLHDLGGPRDVVKPLAQKKPYRTWLAAFAGMAACAFIPGQTGFGIFAFRGYRLCFERGGLHLGLVLALLGMVLALVWFPREKDGPKAPVPKGIIVTLAVLLVWIGLVFLFHWAVIYHLDGFLAMWGMTQVWPGPLGVMEPRTVFISKWAIILLSHWTSYSALYWLAKARVSDRRWAAVYILGLTAATISLETFATMTSMDVTADFTFTFFDNLLKCAVITAAGLAGAWVSLYCTLPHIPHRKRKPPTQKNYMARLERWARWMLPHQEAEDVIADYRDVVNDPVLRQNLGRPRDVVRPLAATETYRFWLAAFAVMAVCILAPGISGSIIGFPLWIYLFDGWVGHPYGAYIAALGAVAALAWFRWKGRKEGNLPKAIPILLAVFLACIGYVLWFCWACSRDFDGFLELWGTVKVWIGPSVGEPTSASFYLSQIAMGDAAAVMAFIGVYSLVKARMGDRRWAAVYVLAVTAILVALLTLDWSGRMDPTGTTHEELFRQMLTRCSLIAAAGLVGTGVALC